jgi:hypothetical protein
MGGHLEVLPLLLADKRVDPSARDNEAVTLAAAQADPAVIQLLLSDPQVDPGAQENNAIKIACDCGHIRNAELLLQDEQVNPSTRNIHFEQPAMTDISIFLNYYSEISE